MEANTKESGLMENGMVWAREHWKTKQYSLGYSKMVKRKVMEKNNCQMELFMRELGMANRLSEGNVFSIMAKSMKVSLKTVCQKVKV